MNVAVCVLWHPGDPWRTQLWQYTRARWRTFGYEPVTGRSSKGLVAARNNAARRAGDWDVAVFTDADIALGTKRQLDTAVAAAEATGSYVCCYDRMCYLTREQTVGVLEGVPLDVQRGMATMTGIWEGAFAIRRDLWDELGGMDERFGPRVGQSIAFIHAAATLANNIRVQGDAFHLWHPDVEGRVRDPELWGRYRDATGDPAMMRELLRR